MYHCRATMLIFLGSMAVLGADWRQFRGPNRDNISTDAAISMLAADWATWLGPNRDGKSMETGLLRTWPAGGPKVLWKIPVCEGYAGAAIKDGRVYLNDYDAEKKEHLVRCISIADGKDIWQWRYAVEIAHAEKRRCRPRNYSWAELLRRTFSVDVLVCNRCGGRMRILAAINPPDTIKKILVCLGLPSRPPPIAPAILATVDHEVL